MKLVGRVVKVTRRAPGSKRFLTSGENIRLGAELPTGIDQVRVAEITYLKVKKHWMYLSVIMDLYSRRIIAWTLDKRRTAEVTKRTLQYALKKRRPPSGFVLTRTGVSSIGGMYFRKP